MHSKSAWIGVGSVSIGCFFLLAHCGSSSANPPGPDGSAPDGSQDATAGDTSVPDAAGPDAGEDANTTRADGAADASPDVTTDAPSDGALDGGADVDAHEAGIPCDVDAQTPWVGASTVKCCSGFCTDTALDPANCGACGAGCTTKQFCTGTACADAILANVCANPKGTVVLDPFAADDEAGISVGAALTTTCVPATTIVQLSQDAGDVVDPNSGRPITGVGNTFIGGGGGYGLGQRGVAYLDQAALSALYLYYNGSGDTYQIQNRSNGSSVVDAGGSTLTAHHDFFYVQLTVEPQSGTLCFSVVGIEAPGTQAGGYYVATQLIPNRATYTASWYVYEWTDTNNDSIANAGDTFTMVGSGP